MSHLHGFCIQEPKMDCLDIAQQLNYRRLTHGSKHLARVFPVLRGNFFKFLHVSTTWSSHGERKHCVRSFAECSLMYSCTYSVQILISPLFKNTSTVWHSYLSY